MECACIDSVSGGDLCTLLKTERPTARKKHRCYECNDGIKKGYEYLRETLIHENGPFRIKTCENCESIRGQFFCTYVFGEVREHFRNYLDECGGEISESKIAKLTPNAREWVCEQIENHWNKYGEDEL